MRISGKYLDYYAEMPKMFISIHSLLSIFLFLLSGEWVKERNPRFSGTKFICKKL